MGQWDAIGIDLLVLDITAKMDWTVMASFQKKNSERNRQNVEIEGE